jgi:serine/threonine protein kinase
MSGHPRTETPPPALDPFGIVGRVVDGRYLVQRVVGSGGFGVVYRASHLRFAAPVAIKVLRPLRESPDAAGILLERVQAEGRLLFDLAPLHASFVRVFECGSLETAGRRSAPFLALEWLEGETLATHLRRQPGPLGLEAVLALFHDVIEGLAVAHERRVAHRDVKPANVFLSRHRGRIVPRILDLGLAKVMSESSFVADPFADTSSFSGCSAFTPAYAAPEQWSRRLGATGTWTDVYALAFMLVELLGGRHPHRDSTPPELMAACLHEKRRPTPRALGVDVSVEVEAAFARALAVDPRRRFRDAGEFWRALSAAAGFVRVPGATLSAITQPREAGASRDALPAATANGSAQEAPLGFTSSTGRHERATARSSLPKAGSRRGLVAGATALAVASSIAVALARAPAGFNRAEQARARSAANTLSTVFGRELSEGADSSFRKVPSSIALMIPSAPTPVRKVAASRRTSAATPDSAPKQSAERPSSPAPAESASGDGALAPTLDALVNDEALTRRY